MQWPALRNEPLPRAVFQSKVVDVVISKLCSCLQFGKIELRYEQPRKTKFC